MMTRAKYIYFFWMLAFIFQTAHSVPPIRQLITAVMDAKASMREKKFFKSATHEFIIPYSASRNERLVKMQHLQMMAPLLVLGIEHLHDISGFAGTLEDVLLSLEHITAAGQYYEIEKALEIIMTHSTERIRSMNCKLVKPDQSESVYIDILTTKRVIECKAINWSRNPERINTISSKLCNQFLTQQAIVNSINETSSEPLIYQVHSKKPVASAWKAWFNEQKIHLVEEKN